MRLSRLNSPTSGRCSSFSRSERRGFTLGQLLFVIALLMVGAGAIFLVEARIRTDSRSRTCMANVRLLGTALVEYSIDHDDALPPYGDIEPAPGRAEPGARANASNPAELRALLQIYVDDPAWFCPFDGLAGKAVSCLGVRHQFSSYAIPAHRSKNGEPARLSTLAVKAENALVWDAAGDRSSCDPAHWPGGSEAWASNHDDGSVNYVLPDLSVRHTWAKTAGAWLQ